jgi:hypothetical protein
VVCHTIASNMGRMLDQTAVGHTGLLLLIACQEIVHGGSHHCVKHGSHARSDHSGAHWSTDQRSPCLVPVVLTFPGRIGLIRAVVWSASGIRHRPYFH